MVLDHKFEGNGRLFYLVDNPMVDLDLTVLVCGLAMITMEEMIPVQANSIQFAKFMCEVIYHFLNLIK